MKRFSLKLAALLLTCLLCLTACTVVVQPGSGGSGSSGSSGGSGTSSTNTVVHKISSSDISVNFTQTKVNENYSSSAYSVTLAGTIANNSTYGITAKTVSVTITLYDKYGNEIPYPYGTITIPSSTSPTVSPSSITNLNAGYYVNFTVKDYPVKKTYGLPAQVRVTKITVS